MLLAGDIDGKGARDANAWCQTVVAANTVVDARG
jgi:hypothetical protein